MNKKKYLLMLIVLIVVVGCGRVDKNTEISKHKRDLVKIGALLPLSGSAAQYGDWVKKGLDLAQEQFNSQNPKKQIELIYEDVQIKPSLAVSAFDKLTNVDNLKFIISQGSTISISLIKLSNKAEVLQMEVNATSPEYRTLNDYTFRAALTAMDLNKNLAPLIIDELGIKKVAILYINDDFGSGMKNFFIQIYQSLGGSVTQTEPFLLEDSDFKTHLSKLDAASAEAIIFFTVHTKTPLILNQAREIGIQKKLISDFYTVESQYVLDTAKEAAEGVIYVAPRLDFEKNNNAKVFKEKFYTKYNTLPHQSSVQAYDGFMVLAESIQNCEDEDTKCVKEYLETNTFQGVFGDIKFDSAGDVVSSVEFILKQVKDGEFVEYR